MLEVVATLIDGTTNSLVCICGLLVFVVAEGAEADEEGNAFDVEVFESSEEVIMNDMAELKTIGISELMTLEDFVGVRFTTPTETTLVAWIVVESGKDETVFERSEL